MQHTKIKKFILPLFLCATIATAQEKLGISNSNYYSSTSIYLNPASSVDSKTFAQLNLIGANAYVMTNAGYLPAYNVWQGVKQGAVIKTTKNNKFGFGNLSLEGPALVISTGEFGFGFFGRLRAEGDVRKVPYQLANIFQGQTKLAIPSTVNNIDIKNLKTSGMAWAEYGLNFGKMIQKNRDIIISAGGNLKYITGIGIAYANLQQFNLSVNGTHADLNNLAGKLRGNSPAWNTGWGLGLDLGVTYKKMLEPIDSYFANSKKSGCRSIDYKYKIGIALLDLGYIRFTKNTLQGDVDASLQIPNYNKIARSTVRKAFNLKENNPFLASLPAGITAQMDYNLKPHFYLNATVIKNIVPTSFTGVQRSNLLSITPRYETKQIELATPLTFQHFIYPQLGFAVRVRSFVVGVDNIVPLLMKANTNVLNAYFNLGISLFKNPSCREKKSFREPKRRLKQRGGSQQRQKSFFPNREERRKNRDAVSCARGLNAHTIKKKERKEAKQKKKATKGKK